MTEKFVHVVICNKCGWKGRGSSLGADSAMFLYYNKICPKCGTESSNWSLNFYQKVMKVVYDKVWWKPWTWLSFHLEEIEGDA